jgi:hypothetical protein
VNLDAKTVVGAPIEGTGVAVHEDNDICGATFNDSVVTCHGDLATSCANYGIATWAGLTCRTFCGDSGDPGYCYIFNTAPDDVEVGTVLICDRLASS